MTRELESRKDLVDEEVTRHDNTRHCEEGKHSAARRGNLLNGLLRHFVPRNDGDSGTPQSLINVKGLARASRGRALSSKMTKSLQTTSADPFNASEQEFAYSPIGLFALKRAAFTLAEVLITLGVIGIVAAMTIPTLIQNYREKETVVKLKKVYSILSNAYLMARAEDENVKNWFPANGTQAAKSEAFYNHLKPYLKISKDCGFEKGCLAEGMLKTLGGTDYVDYNSNSNQSEYRIILADGTSLMFYIHIPNTDRSPVDRLPDYIGNIKADIDGLNGPYTFGKDFFIFDVTDSKLLPNGVIQREAGAYNCDRKNTNRGDTGANCTAWVIYNENMDYLHCDDLSWDGKHKCSD